MTDTLYGIRQDFWRDRQFHGEYELPLDDRLQASVDESEAELVIQFYENNPLAQQVASGETSYRQQIQPFLDWYGGIVNKLWSFRRNKALDEEIQAVVESMNGVGAEEHHHPPGKYTTANIRKWWAAMEGSFSFLGVVFASSVACLAFAVIPYEASSGEPVTLGSVAFGVMVPVSFSVLYGMGKGVQISSTNNYLRDLTELAETNDKFLSNPKEFLIESSA